MSITKNIRTQPDFQFPSDIIAILGEINLFTADQLARLADCFRGIENAIWRPEVTASFPATLVAAAKSTPWKPAHGGHLTELEALVKEVGSTSTIVKAYKTDTGSGTRTLIGTITIASGAYSGSLYLNEPFKLGIDMIHYEIDTAGTGASHLSIIGRWNADPRGT